MTNYYGEEMNIRKLTPRLLKRIINEEKRKLNKKPVVKKNKKRKLSEVKKLKLIRKKQLALLKEVKKLHLARKRIKKNLIKRL